MASINFKSLILGILIGAAVLGATLYFTGFFTPPVAVQQVKQPPPSPSPSPCDNGNQHKVNVSTLTVDPEVNFEFVVLCKNDTLTWAKGSGTKSFTVDFDSGTPLKDTGGNDKSHFSDSPNDGSGTAKDLHLQPGNFAYFKYKVVVTDTAGKQHPYDPGVIIVP